MQRQKQLATVLKKIGSFDLLSFKGRLLFQKRIYLLKALGLPLGYSFSWYIHGPYSPRLTRDGFELVAIMEKQRDEPLSQREEQIIANFVSWVGTRYEDEKWLELVSSIHFLKNRVPGMSKDSIKEKLFAKMPSITEKVFNEAWKNLKDARLLK